MSGDESADSSPPNLRVAIEVADELIALVRGVGDHGGGTGDRTGLVMVGAYRNGFRRFVSIRELAGRGAGEDAYILLRALLSGAARALWVNQPQDPAEWEERLLRYRRKDIEDGVHILGVGEAAGLGDDATAEMVRDFKDELLVLDVQGVKRLPPDRQLLEAVQMGLFYARFFPLASEHVHGSLSVALEKLQDAETVPLEEPQWELAVEALQAALVAMALLLEVSDQYASHGISVQAGEIVQGLFVN